VKQTLRQAQTIMSAKWIISVEGRTYGPYTVGQMHTFAVEGRLAAHSLVARDEDGRFAPVSQDPDLAFLFQPASTATQIRRIAEETQRSFGQSEPETTEEPSHYLIVADMKSGSITALEDEILKIGPAYPVMPQAWVLSTELSTGALRNLLVQKMGKLDLLFIANATQDKIAWVNLGLEAETRVRRIWTKHLQLSAA
jgi:hypothetical protein